MHHGHRSLFATPDAGRRNHAHLAAEQRRQAFQQLFGAGHLATQAVANAHRQCGRLRHGAVRVLLHHVEVMIEACHLVDLGLCEFHALRQRGQVRRAELAVAVVDSMQVFDEQVAPQRSADQRLDLGHGLRVNQAALGTLTLALLARRQGGDGDGRLIHLCTPIHMTLLIIVPHFDTKCLATDSATHAGLEWPSRSVVTSTITCAPPEMGSNAMSLKWPRNRLPTGTGAGNRTRFNP